MADVIAPYTVKTVPVEHRMLVCEGSFEAVRRALLAMVPPLDPSLAPLLAGGDAAAIAKARRDGPDLYLFLQRDHGALTVADGQHRKAIQFEIGNPLTAERMTREVLAAGLYAPLRVLLYEDEAGQVVFEYDLPSSTLDQFGNLAVSTVAKELDSELESLLLSLARTAKS